MKRLLLIVCAVLCSVSLVSAAGKVSKFFKSYDWTPKYKSEVNVGLAMTGSKLVFDKEFSSTVSVLPSSSSSSETEYESAAVKTNTSRIFAETIHGIQFDQYLFVGAGVGLQYYTGKLHDYESVAKDIAMYKGKDEVAKRWNAVAMPLFVNVRLMYPIKKTDLTPFINLGLGGTAVFSSALNMKYEGQDIENPNYDVTRKTRLRGGFYCDFGGGVRWKQWNFAIGLQSQGLKLVEKSEGDSSSYHVLKVNKLKTTSNSFYLKAGWCF